MIDNTYLGFTDAAFFTVAAVGRTLYALFLLVLDNLWMFLYFIVFIKPSFIMIFFIKLFRLCQRWLPVNFSLHILIYFIMVNTITYRFLFIKFLTLFNVPTFLFDNPTANR